MCKKIGRQTCRATWRKREGCAKTRELQSTNKEKKGACERSRGNVRVQKMRSIRETGL